MREVKKIGMICLMVLMCIVEIPVSILTFICATAEMLIDTALMKVVLALGNHRYIDLHRANVDTSAQFHDDMAAVYMALSGVEES